MSETEPKGIPSPLDVEAGLSRQLKRVWWIIGIAAACLALLIIFLETQLPSTSASGSSSTLSEDTRRKAFYHIVSTQDQDPYSNEWNEGVKQAAADYYHVPMSTINDVIHEGVTNHWMTPPPP